MNRAEWIRSGVALALGSDIGAGYERSMVRVGRAAIEAASSLGESYPSAAEVWWQITHGNARALGWPDADRFVVDGHADLLVIKPDISWLDDQVDPLATLMFAWDDRWLQSTVVSGSVVYQR